MAFLATRRGSRFAAQEFAIIANEAYERGLSVASLRMDISLLGLSTQNRMGLSEQDAFLSNIGGGVRAHSFGVIAQGYSGGSTELRLM